MERFDLLDKKDDYFSFKLDVNMERYAEEYDVAIVGGGPDILFLNDFCFYFFLHISGYFLNSSVYLVFQLPFV